MQEVFYVLIKTLFVIVMLVAGNFAVSYIRGLSDDYNYVRKDLKRFIDHYEPR